MRSRPVVIQLSNSERFDAKWVAFQRMHAGKVRKLEGGSHPLVGEIEGALAEFAVAHYFGVRPAQWVLEGRGGPEDDLVVGDLRVGVKGTRYWNKPHLIVRPYDTSNDRYVLVSVKIGPGRCALQGWISGEGLKEFPPRPFRKGARPSRNVPCSELEPMDAWYDEEEAA